MTVAQAVESRKDVTLAFRPRVDQVAKLVEARDLFPNCSWAEMFRWLIDQPEFDSMIERRLAQMTKGS